MYNVFNKTLQTDMGKTIVRKYATDFDAQAVYIELVEHMSSSTLAETMAEDLLQEIITANAWGAE